MVGTVGPCFTYAFPKAWPVRVLAYQGSMLKGSVTIPSSKTGFYELTLPAGTYTLRDKSGSAATALQWTMGTVAVTPGGQVRLDFKPNC